MINIIDKIYHFLVSKKTIIGFFIVFGILYVCSLWHRYIQSDENWFGEQAYWLLHEGVVRIKSMPGILDFDKRMFVYHQLFVFIGAGLIKMFGWSVYVLKNFTLFCYILFFILFYQYFRKNPEYSRSHFIASVLLIVVCPIMALQSYMFRPEIFVMVLGFISYSFLHLFFKENKTRYIILGALFAGLAFLTTYNGLAFPIAGFVMLFFRKKYKALIPYSLVAFPVCMLFSFELWQNNHFEIFMYQFKNWPTWKFGVTYMDQHVQSLIVKKLTGLANIFQFFFWSDRVMFFSAIFFISLFFRLKFIWSQHRPMLIYLISVMLSLDLLGSFIAERYLIYVFPFMAILSGISIVDSLNNNKMIFKTLILICMFLQIGFLAKTYRFIFSLNNGHAARHREAMSRIPEKNATVIAPWAFIFNEIGKQNHISYKAIEYYEDELGKKMNGVELFSLIKNRYSAKYIIVQRKIRNEPDWYNHWFDNMDVLMKNDHYRLLSSNEDFYVFMAK